jgi:hypothetical protein
MSRYSIWGFWEKLREQAAWQAIRSTANRWPGLLNLCFLGDATRGCRPRPRAGWQLLSLVPLLRIGGLAGGIPEVRRPHETVLLFSYWLSCLIRKHECFGVDAIRAETLERCPASGARATWRVGENVVLDDYSSLMRMDRQQPI